MHPVCMKQTRRFFFTGETQALERFRFPRILIIVSEDAFCELSVLTDAVLVWCATATEDLF